METVARGEWYWADLPPSRGSEPVLCNPVMIERSDAFNRCRIRTVVVAVLTTNLRLAQAPSSVVLPASRCGLPAGSVVNVSQILSLDREFLAERGGKIASSEMIKVEEGLRVVLSL